MAKVERRYPEVPFTFRGELFVRRTILPPNKQPLKQKMVYTSFVMSLKTLASPRGEKALG
jgi:hypothetical protein